MRPYLSLIAVGAIVGMVVGRALEIESFFGRVGMMIAGAAVMWGIMKLMTKSDSAP